MGEAHDRVQTAIDRLRNFEPPEGYYLAFSGGKDSQAIYHLAKQAGVKFDAYYHVTSVDPPELVQFIRRQYPDVHFDIPHDKSGKPVTMWSLIASQTMPPTRMARYCCAQLKETAGQGRLVVTGVRWSESVRRKNNRHLIDSGRKEGQYTNYDNEDTRKMVEQCYLKRRTTLNPIIDWDETDVWEYLNDIIKVQHCELYDQGFKRLGCIGCPMKSPKAVLEDFECWPKYRDNYLRAFVPMLENAKKRIGGTRWETVDDVMRWWIGQENNVKIDENQMGIEEEYDE
jgi:phosphoadenosine phosphosulfate reductase